nr:aminotransferase class V-fold PLP-dependent enzyme [Paracoccaceae bacterium]
MYDVERIRRDFPILSREVNGKPLVYLDNGASAQKPQAVIDAVTQAYSMEYANVHRGLHYLSNLATDNYEAVRGKIARFLGAPSDEEIVFTTGTTMGIVVLKWVEPEPDGSLPAEKMLEAIGPRTRLIAVTQMSNVLGTKVDVAAICAGARARGVAVLVDGSQAAVHMPVDLAAMQPDFYAITGHKLYGPSGSGAIFIRRERMDEMRPFMGGGDMIREVARDHVSYADPPMKFEAGTPGI